MVRKLAYWHKIDAADREALLALPHTVKSLEQHHYIIRERERATHSCLLLSGFILAMTLLPARKTRAVGKAIRDRLPD